MNTFDIQSKSNKVAATQENTAQNSDNQSKVFGVFNESELAFIVDSYNNDRVKNGEKIIVTPNFVIRYLKQAERILNKARMNEEQKEYIKAAIGLLVGFGKYKERTKDELIFQSYSPDEIRMELEEGGMDKDDITEAIKYEIDSIMVDISDMENYNCDGFYDDDIIDYKNAIIEFVEIAEDYDIELGEERMNLINDL